MLFNQETIFPSIFFTVYGYGADIYKSNKDFTIHNKNTKANTMTRQKNLRHVPELNNRGLLGLGNPQQYKTDEYDIVIISWNPKVTSIW